MTFANVKGGLKVYTDGFKMYGEEDLIKILFAENPAVVIQVEDSKKESVEKILDEAAVKYFPIACPAEERVIMVTHDDNEHLFGIDWLRDVWFKPSYLLDSLQSAAGCAEERFNNYKRQPHK